jgi:hypothetical protein
MAILSILYLPNRIIQFYQDRLGTNIGKTQKRECRFLAGRSWSPSALSQKSCCRREGNALGWRPTLRLTQRGDATWRARLKRCGANCRWRGGGGDGDGGHTQTRPEGWLRLQLLMMMRVTRVRESLLGVIGAEAAAGVGAGAAAAEAEAEVVVAAAAAAAVKGIGELLCGKM